VTLIEDKMRRFKSECAHFSFNKCPIYTHDDASTKFSTNSHKTDNSVEGAGGRILLHILKVAALCKLAHSIHCPFKLMCM
jgi:hypothetical protein